MDIANLILSIESKRIMLIIATFHALQLFQKINLLDLCALRNQLILKYKKNFIMKFDVYIIYKIIFTEILFL